MGLTLLHKLAEDPSRPVFIFNRGNGYWNNTNGKLIAKTEHFTHVIADRHDPKFSEVVKKAVGDRKVHAVVDFSCYDLAEA